MKKAKIIGIIVISLGLVGIFEAEYLDRESLLVNTIFSFVFIYLLFMAIKYIIKLAGSKFSSIISFFQSKHYEKQFPKSKQKINLNCLNYVKSLSYAFMEIGDNVSEIVLKQLDNIKKIQPTSVLYNYLTGFIDFNNSIYNKGSNRLPYFPFGYNSSQKSAVTSALNNKISIIEGPPGTGKTQTILNIISNAILRDQSVAVVSNNNSAILNIAEKLEKENLSFISAFLGSKDNKDNFFTGIGNSPIPSMKKWPISLVFKKFYEGIYSLLGVFLRFMLFIQNKNATVNSELSQLVIEHQHFSQASENQDCDEISDLVQFFATSKNILKLCAILQIYQENSLAIPSFSKFKYLVLCGFKLSSYEKNMEETILILQDIYYKKRISHLKFISSFFDLILKGFFFHKLNSIQRKISMKLFKSEIYHRYYSTNHFAFNSINYKSNYSKFIKRYPVILSTTYSLNSSCPKNYLFDYVIMDEASQIDIRTGILAFSCAKNVVIVGDKMQLAHIISTELKPIVEDFTTQYGFENSPYDYKNSILSSALQLWPYAHKTLLKEHYRCHPEIIDFCNQRFYGGQLIIHTKPTTTNPITLIKTAPGNHARKAGKSWVNQRQLDVISQEILTKNNINSYEESVGIIMPFAAQESAGKALFAYTNCSVATIDKFQGQEKNIIIISTTANQDNPFISEPNKLNVAISRAIDKLFLIIADHDSFLNGNSPLTDFVKYIEYNNFEIVESKVYSIFDLLYTRYSKEILKILGRLEKKSEYKSENLLYAVIKQVLKLPEFVSLSCAMHVPLKSMLKDLSVLNSEQVSYASNFLTHVDFLIFSKASKSPILAIEVDGHAFHADNPHQLARDEMKDAILEIYSIPILRLKTTESGEMNRIVGRLNGLI